MAKEVYVGVNSVARKVGDKAYFGVGNVARKVLKMYIGVGNVARLCWEAVSPYSNRVFLMTNPGNGGYREVNPDTYATIAQYTKSIENRSFCGVGGIKARLFICTNWTAGYVYEVNLDTFAIINSSGAIWDNGTNAADVGGTLDSLFFINRGSNTFGRINPNNFAVIASSRLPGGSEAQGGYIGGTPTRVFFCGFSDTPSNGTFYREINPETIAILSTTRMSRHSLGFDGTSLNYYRTDGDGESGSGYRRVGKVNPDSPGTWIGSYTSILSINRLDVGGTK